MVQDFPSTIFLDVEESVSGLHLGVVITHGEFINTPVGKKVEESGSMIFISETCRENINLRILSKLITCPDVSVSNDTLWLSFKERVEVVFDQIRCCTRCVRYGRKEDSILSVTEATTLESPVARALFQTEKRSLISFSLGLLLSRKKLKNKRYDTPAACRCFDWYCRKTGRVLVARDENIAKDK